MTHEELKEAFEELNQGFMKPCIVQETYVTVDTTAGMEIVLVAMPEGVSLLYAEDMQDHCEGTVLAPTAQLKVESGWLARLSAPGYTDCTDWTEHPSREAAERYLVNMYGE